MSVQLKNPSEISNLTPQRTNKLANSYRTFKRQVISQQQELSAKQTDKLQQFIDNIKKLNSKLTVMRSQCQQKHKNLITQIDEHESKLVGFLTGEQNIQFQEKVRNKMADDKKEFIKLCETRVRTAESIDYKVLKKIEIQERKSPAHEVFKWIIVAMYIEPESKYYWPNFSSQVLGQMEALEDLKERLGKINAFNAKEEQRVKTKQFIETFDKIKETPELKNFVKEIQKLYEIAKIFQQCCQIGKRMKDHQSQLEKNNKKQAQQNDELEQRRRECDALLEKKKVEVLYLNQLKTVQKAMHDKVAVYEKEKEQAKMYLSELSSMSSEVTMVTVSEKEHRQKCECQIY